MQCVLQFALDCPFRVCLPTSLKNCSLSYSKINTSKLIHVKGHNLLQSDSSFSDTFLTIKLNALSFKVSHA